MRLKLKYIFTALLCAAIINNSSAQTITAYKAEDLMKRLSTNSDTFYVVNFWATWCGPCIKELPEFDKVADKFRGRNVKVLLVSLDFPDQYEKRIPKFINKKNLQHEVVWLNETKANEFIPKIDNRWQGSIPATLLYYKKNKYTKFFEGIVEAKELNPLVGKQLSRLY